MNTEKKEKKKKKETEKADDPKWSNSSLQKINIVVNTHHPVSCETTQQQNTKISSKIKQPQNIKKAKKENPFKKHRTHTRTS